jgi:MoaA/NifB/PqqE/SkfB family radical SAM enzyme
VTKKFSLIRSFVHSRVHTFLNHDSFHPLFVHFESTNRCNMKCSFCNVWRKNICEDEASTLELEKKLIECWDLGCFITSFSGGEPLLREDIGKLLEFSSRKIGFYTGLVTNGLLLDKKIDEISKYTDFLAVSFDANDRQIFNKTRGVDALEKIKKNIVLARSEGVEINLFSVLTKETFECIDDTIDFAKSLEIPIHFSPVDNVPREYVEISEAGKLKIDETGEIIKKLNQEKKKYRKIHFETDYLKFQSQGGFNRFIRCSSASSTISLKPNASITLPCPFFTLIEIRKTENLRKGLNSERARSVIKECGKLNFCKNCSINCMYVASLINYPYFLLRWIKDKL